jgi:hypothetical protein
MSWFENERAAMTTNRFAGADAAPIGYVRVDRRLASARLWSFGPIGEEAAPHSSNAPTIGFFVAVWSERLREALGVWNRHQAPA